MTYFFDPETRTPKELVPGVVVRTFWGEQMLASLVDLAAGAIVPSHSHPHEQFGMLLRGEMQMTIAGETRTVQAGDLYFVPGGVDARRTRGRCRRPGHRGVQPGARGVQVSGLRQAAGVRGQESGVRGRGSDAPRGAPKESNGLYLTLAPESGNIGPCV